jgi:nitrite reductase/ring-hydroxylating ferredoxin subunit
MPRSDKEFYPQPIELATLDRDSPNRRELGEGLEVVVLVRGEDLSIFRDLCPHMGGSLSEGEFDAQDNALRCPWHGYAYDAATGELSRNPNDEIFACMKGLYKSYKPEKTPKYRLAPLAYEREQGKAWVRRPGNA